MRAENARRSSKSSGLGSKLAMTSYLAATAVVVLVAGVPAGPLSPRLPIEAGPLPPFRWAASAAGLDRLSSSGRAAVAAIALGLAGFAFLLVLFNAWRGRLPVSWLLGIGLGLLALTSVLPVLGAHDVPLYAIQGRIAGVHHVNPYVAARPDFSTDPIYPFVADLWHPLSPSSGPAFVQVAAGLARFVRDPAALIASFKIVAAVAGVGVIFLVVGLARRLAPDRVGLAVALFAWNPLVLFIGVGGGHNELVLLLLVVGAFTLVAGGGDSNRGASWREPLATGLLTLATLVKAPGAVALALHVAVSVMRRPAGRRLHGLAIHGSIVLALVALIAGPFLSAENPTLGLSRTWRYQTFLAPAVLIGGWAGWILSWVGIEGMSGLLGFITGITLLMIFGTLVVRLVRRTLSASPAGVAMSTRGELWGLGLLALVLSSPLLQPWYLVLALPFAWLFGHRLAFAVAAAAALAAVAASVIPEPVYAEGYDGLVAAFTRPVAAPALLALAVLLISYLDRRIRSVSPPEPATRCPRRTGGYGPTSGAVRVRPVRPGRRSGPARPRRPPAIRGPPA